MKKEDCNECEFLEARNHISYQESWTDYYCSREGFKDLDYLYKCPLVRYELRQGDFGFFFFDSFKKKELPLKEVLQKLNKEYYFNSNIKLDKKEVI